MIVQLTLRSAALRKLIKKTQNIHIYTYIYMEFYKLNANGKHSIIAEKNTCSSVSENEGGCKKSNYIYFPMKKEEFLESAKVSF